MIKWLGVTYRFHPLFTLVIAASAVSGYFLEIITLFTIVLIHEMGHVAAAKSLGWSVKEVQLLPFGGVAVTDDQGRGSSLEEAAVALAGPLQNGVLIGAAFFFRWAGWWTDDWANYFIRSNLLIAGFNMLPVMPLDGGRLMRAVMCRWLDYYRALSIGIWTSLAASAIIVIGACIPWGTPGIQLNVLAIGLFLIYSNWYELRHMPYLFMRFLMRRQMGFLHLLEKGAASRLVVVPANRRIGPALRLLNRAKISLFCCINDRGEVQGVVSEQKLLTAFFADAGPGREVSELFM